MVSGLRKKKKKRKIAAGLREPVAEQLSTKFDELRKEVLALKKQIAGLPPLVIFHPSRICRHLRLRRQSNPLRRSCLCQFAPPPPPPPPPPQPAPIPCPKPNPPSGTGSFLDGIVNGVTLNPVTPADEVTPLPFNTGGGILDEIARQMEKIREFHKEESSDTETEESSNSIR
jgi:hypothetical protein